jgi:hypothetical protein
VTELLLAILFVAGLVALLVYVMGRKSPYEEMTDEEFEDKAREGSGSLAGAAVAGLEGVLRKREAAIMMEAKNLIERDATPSPGEPPQEEIKDFHSKQ